MIWIWVERVYGGKCADMELIDSRKGQAAIKKLVYLPHPQTTGWLILHTARIWKGATPLWIFQAIHKALWDSTHRRARYHLK